MVCRRSKHHTTLPNKEEQLMTKVCFVSPEYWPLTGGTGSYVYYLVNELLKNGYNIHVVTGSNQTRDVHVNPQLDVSFLKIPKMPAVKSFILAGNSNRKLQSIKKTANIDIMHPQLPLDAQLCGSPQLWQNACLHCPLDLERRSRSHQQANPSCA